MSPIENQKSKIENPEVLRLTDVEAAQNGRFSRFELIGWWDQQRLAESKVLVIGAGAIGNELVKNLALLGIGNVFIADLDRVENSNLSRSVLYREADIGRPKAEVAAARAKEIYPGIKASSFVGNIVYDLGLGAYRWADVILGGLDNREARVAINQAAARVGRIWIDGAIERLDGVARPVLRMHDERDRLEDARSSAELRPADSARDGARQGADYADHRLGDCRHSMPRGGQAPARFGDAGRTGLRLRGHLASELRRELHAPRRLPNSRGLRADRCEAVVRRDDDRWRVAGTCSCRSR